VKATVKKKTYNLDGEMIAKVRRLLNAKTDTETIQRALRKAIEDRGIPGRVAEGRSLSKDLLPPASRHLLISRRSL